MLFPYDKRAAVIDPLPRDYVTTVVSDLRRFHFTGFCLTLAQDRAFTLLYQDGQEKAAAIYWPGQGMQRVTPACSRILDNLPETVAVHLLNIPADVASLARLGLRGRVCASTSGPLTAEEVPALCPSCPDGVLLRHAGPVCELAALRHGTIWVGYRFDPEQRHFLRVDAQGFLAAPPEGALYEWVEPLLIHPKPLLDTRLEPLDILTETYTAVLNLAEGTLRELEGSKAATLGDRLLEHFKAKYPPLYRGLYRNPETGFINWDQLPLNRDKVGVAYRYDRFVLYLDEVVLKYFQGLRKESGAAGLERMAQALSRLRQASPDPDFAPLRELFSRLDRFLAAAAKG